MTWHRVLPVDEIPEGRPHHFDVDGRAICVTRIGAVTSAMSDVCPHNGASLSGGILKNGCITCPAHLWRFSIVDGRKQGDARTQVPIYPTRVIDAWLEVDLPPRPVERSLREILLAHAHGESDTAP
jgi:nitrite reductase (NADH) small subunit